MFLGLWTSSKGTQYIVTWCWQCTGFIISHSCEGTTCNGGGCKECFDDFEEFNETAPGLRSIVSEDEVRVFEGIVDKIREKCGELYS